jgi:glucose dehydrogenase
MKRSSGTLLAAGILATLAGALAQSNRGQPTGASNEWPTYGHDPGGMRFSPLTEIKPANVDRLKVAWVYHTRRRRRLWRDSRWRSGPRRPGTRRNGLPAQ